MSFLDSLAAGLQAMGFAQMGFAHAALLAYIVALNGSLPGRWRGAAALTALVCVAAFATLAPSWPGGIALAGLGVVGCALFTAVAWVMAVLLGVDSLEAKEHDVPEMGERDSSVAPASVFACASLPSPHPFPLRPQPHPAAPAPGKPTSP